MEDFKKQNIQDSSTYLKLRRLIVEDSISAISDSVSSICGNDFISMLSNVLLGVRKNGYVLVLLDIYGSPLDLKINFITDQSKLYLSNGKLYFNNREVSTETLLIIGDIEDCEKFKFNPTISQLRTILLYEDAVFRIDERDKMSTMWFTKIHGYTDMVQSNNSSGISGIRNKVSSLLKSKEKKIAIVDSEDEIDVKQSTINIDAIREIKQKLAFDFSIPYTRLFDSDSTGLSNQNLQDITNWNTQVFYFMSSVIYPACKRYLEIIGKADKIKDLTIEPIDYEDKMVKANIIATYFNMYSNAFSQQIISKEEFRDNFNKLLTKI